MQLCAGSNYNQPGSTFQIAELLQASDIDFDSHALFLPMLQPSLSGIFQDSNTHIKSLPFQNQCGPRLQNCQHIRANGTICLVESYSQLCSFCCSHGRLWKTARSWFQNVVITRPLQSPCVPAGLLAPLLNSNVLPNASILNLMSCFVRYIYKK